MQQHLSAVELESIRAGGHARSQALRHLDRCLACRRAFGQAVKVPASRMPRPWIVAAAAALVVVVFLATPLRTLAGGFLEVFEPRTVTIVPLTLDDMRGLSRMPDLSDYGTARDLVRSQDASAPDARTASALARFAVRLPTAGVRPVEPASGHVSYDGGASAMSTSLNLLHVIGPSAQQFVFSAARARAAAAAKHLVPRPMPPGLDGSALEIDLGSAVVANYLSTAPPSRAFYRDTQAQSGEWSQGTPVIVAQMRAPKIFSTGVPVSVLENYLLAQPGFPPRLAAAFRALGDMSTTLPIPIPIDKAYARPLSVDGVRGIGIGDDTGLGAAVIWQNRGILYAVAGPLAGRDVLAIADSLR